jgi:hypothetical protein
VGSRNGDRFARFAQSVTLNLLVELANTHLATRKPRYRLVRAGQDLGLNFLDHDMGDEARSTRSLSGGERFLAPLLDAPYTICGRLRLTRPASFMIFAGHEFRLLGRERFCNDDSPPPRIASVNGGSR